MTTASDFASSPAGYVIGIVLAVLLTALLGVVGWAVRRQMAFNQQIRATLGETPQGTSFGAALNESTKALAVLVAEATNDREDIAELREVVEVNTSKQNELATSVALLADRLNRHERWSQEETHRLRDVALTGTPVRREETPL